jgi:hypothetical protein
MTWVTWRLQRTETLVAVVLLALIAALLVPTGLSMASAYHHAGLASCLGSRSFRCADAIDTFTGHYQHGVANLFPWFNLVPGIIGVLFATPFVLELESGTFRLAWTQGITRRAWLARKLGITIASASVAAVALTLLLTWWRAPLDHVQGRIDQNVFDFEGTVVVGYVLFALALTLALGAVWRRTAPAVIVGFVGFTVVRIVVLGWLRQRYETPLQATWKIGPVRTGPDVHDAWILSQQPSDRLGHVVVQAFTGALRCGGTGAKRPARAIDPGCLLPKGFGYMHAVYQPASRFWLFQGIETAIFGGLAVALLALTVWWVRERVS